MKALAVRLIISAVLIFLIYRDTHSVWLLVFCWLVTIAQELNIVLIQKCFIYISDITKIIKEMVGIK